MDKKLRSNGTKVCILWSSSLDHSRHVNPRAAYSDSVGLYLNSQNYFEVNGPNRIHFLFAIRLSSKFTAKDWKRGCEQKRPLQACVAGKRLGMQPGASKKIKIFALKGSSATIITVLAATLDFFALKVPFNQNCVTARTIKNDNFFYRHARLSFPLSSARVAWLECRDMLIPLFVNVTLLHGKR